MVDRLLDRTIALGYSRLGYSIRQRWWDRDDPAPDALTGKTVVVTGANSGIGAAIVDGAARLGASVVMVVRDLERGESVRDRLAAAHPHANLMVARCDVSDLTDIANVADRLRAHRPQIDAIIHNAGVLPDRWTGTAQGHEVSLATHVLGPILLTELLLPAFAAAPDPRVVLMSSGGMYAQPLPADDLEYQSSGNYRGVTAYARSKRVQVDLTPALAGRWAGAGVMVAVMHPGWADTPGLSEHSPGSGQWPSRCCGHPNRPPTRHSGWLQRVPHQ